MLRPGLREHSPASFNGEIGFKILSNAAPGNRQHRPAKKSGAAFQLIHLLPAVRLRFNRQRNPAIH
jgi:hypothetical protein